MKENIKEIIEKLKKKIFNNIGLIIFFIVVIFSTFYLDKIVLLLKQNSADESSNIIMISDRILFLTFFALVWYAWETRRMKNEMTTQTELDLKPIPMMYIRDINDYLEEKIKRQWEYCVETALTTVAKNFDEKGSFASGGCEKTFKKYIIRIRNVGRGPLFSLRINSDNFEVKKYQRRFLAPEPKGDEQSIKIIRKDGKEIASDYKELNGAIFEISCENVNKKLYKSRYKIVDVEKQEIEYLG